MVSPWTYLGSVSTSALLPEGNGRIVELLGQPVRAEVGAVRQLMADGQVAPEEQVRLWTGLWRQWPDSDWGEQCLAEAERVQSLLRREATLAQSAHMAAASEAAPSPAAETVIGAPAGELPALAERHFVWLGADRGLRSEHLRDGVAGLARIGMIHSDRAQQDALRRGLGLAVNDEERSHRAPWVDWLGPVDMLAHLVDSLWDMGLITCAGGQQEKWNTAIRMFRKADGSRYRRTIRNSRCTDPDKLRLLDEAILGSLRFYLGAS